MNIPILNIGVTLWRGLKQKMPSNLVFHSGWMGRRENGGPVHYDWQPSLIVHPITRLIGIGVEGKRGGFVIGLILLKPRTRTMPPLPERDTTNDAG